MPVARSALQLRRCDNIPIIVLSPPMFRTNGEGSGMCGDNATTTPPLHHHRHHLHPESSHLLCRRAPENPQLPPGERRQRLTFHNLADSTT